jgi:hypothetical protein
VLPQALPTVQTLQHLSAAGVERGEFCRPRDCGSLFEVCCVENRAIAVLWAGLGADWELADETRAQSARSAAKVRSMRVSLDVLLLYPCCANAILMELC